MFLNPNLRTAPLALRANVDHNHVLHDHVIIVAVEIERASHVPDSERVVADSHITIVPSDAPGMAAWRKKLFVAMARNAAGPAQYFRLPDTRTLTTSGRIQL